MSCGIRFSFPCPDSISLIIRGTTTAGETADKILPRIADSKKDNENKSCPKMMTPMISNVAGRKAINKAGLPIFFKSSNFKAKPALKRMTIKAICLSSLETSRILPSIKSRT